MSNLSRDTDSLFSRDNASESGYTTASVSEAQSITISYCMGKNLDRFLKRVDKWGDVTEREVEDSGTDRTTLEFTKFHEFRSFTETMFSTLKLSPLETDRGVTLQSQFRSSPESAMYDAIIAQRPDGGDQYGTPSLLRIRFAPELDDFLFQSISLRLSGERLRTFKIAVGSNRVVRGLQAVSEEFIINKENVHRRARQALTELKLKPDVNIARLVTLYKNAISRCSAVGLELGYEVLRTIFKSALLSGREENIHFRKCLVAAHKKSGGMFVRYLAYVTEHVFEAYAHKVPLDGAGGLYTQGGGAGRGRGGGNGGSGGVETGV